MSVYSIFIYIYHYTLYELKKFNSYKSWNNL